MTLRTTLKLALPLLIVLLPIEAMSQSKEIKGELNCKMSRAQPYMPCSYVANRKSPGEAKIAVTFPDGTVRTIEYSKGKIVSTDGPKAFELEKYEDLSTLRIGDESYEIVDAIALGG
jgi:hypothetical protein